MIEISWYNEEHTIVLWHISGNWTLSDYQQAAEQTASLIATVSHRVDIIGDFTDALFTPPNIVSTVSTQHRELANRQTNFGSCVLVQANEVLRVMVHIINRIPSVKHRMYLADTVEEAESIIERQRSSS